MAGFTDVVIYASVKLAMTCLVAIEIAFEVGTRAVSGVSFVIITLAVISAAGGISGSEVGNLIRKKASYMNLRGDGGKSGRLKGGIKVDSLVLKVNAEVIYHGLYFVLGDGS